MASENRQTCPTCHQTVNTRRVVLRKGHVQALLKVALWLKKNNRTSAKMTELRTVMTQVQYATFNEWRHFAPYAVKGRGGNYEFDMVYLKAIFTGDEICIEYEVNKLRAEGRKLTRYGTISDAKGVREFLNENNEYVAQYVGKAEIEQGALL